MGYTTNGMRWLLLASLILSLGFSPFPSQEMPPVKHQPPRPKFIYAEYHDQSLPLRDIKGGPVPPALSLPDPQLRRLPKSGSPTSGIESPLLPSQAAGSMPGTLIQWDGINNPTGITPPDTNGDAGPNHYMQWVNLRLAIWDKSGNLLYGPVAGNTLWAGFTGQCQTANYGDPIVLYDPLADRWFASQFVVPTGGAFYQCVAVSATPDPTGAWNRYEFLWSGTKMNDYPKFGVWPDGYYMSVNQFFYNSWAGAGVAVFEREAMLQNLPARMVSFDLFDDDPNFGGMLPADLDGRQAPPSGAPNVFAEWDDSVVFGTPDALRLWDFHVDWGNPSLSTFGSNFQPNFVLPTLDVDPGYADPIRIPQKGTSTKLDAISDRLMYRLQYRNFGDYQTLVSNHTVNASASSTGIHWFELRKTGAAGWSMAQEGVFAPDSNSRWMGSIAMDKDGNIALGYSVSGIDLYPSIAYAGRLASDPPGSMAQGEVIMMAGGGAQLSGYSRWGDYSMMAVDPTDECTFWYTQEYYAATSYTNWRTRIGAFKFPDCSQPDTGILQGTVRSANDSSPIAGAQINAGGTVAFSEPDGTYQMVLPAGEVDVQASAFSYQSQTQPAVIEASGTTTLDFSLGLAEMALVSGVVTDGAGHPGMPLYARIDIPGAPVSPVFSDPFTGQYQVTLSQGSAYSFNVTAVKGGYLAENRVVVPQAGGIQENFGLQPDPAACPPGYQAAAGDCQAQSGGLIAGYVQDANNPPRPVPTGLAGATITDDNSGAIVTADSDPAGYFVLFADEASHSITASYPGYTSQTVSTQVTADQVTGLTFNLPAGYLQVSPGGINLSVSKLAPTAETILNFANQGTAAAVFSLAEFNGPAPDLSPSGPFAAAGRRLSPTRLNALTAEKVYEYTPPGAPVWPGAGSVLRSWPTGLAAPWGLGVGPSGEIWVSDALSGGGDGQDHRYDLEGETSTASIATDWGGDFAADMAADPLRGRAWQVNAGGDNCLYELDLPLRQAAGGRICPPFGNSQRGLAFDPYSQTFYSGTWNDAILTHFDRAGTILDSVDTGINIAGLAYHPGRGHLYVLANGAVGYDVYVLDVHQAYTILGGFDVPGLTDFGQAGMEFAQDGTLWLVDTLGDQVVQVATGEPPLSAQEDVLWLSESPAGAGVADGGDQPVTVSVNGAGLAPGLYQAYLSVTTDTPYDLTAHKINPIAVNLTVQPVHALALSPAAQIGVAAPGRSMVYKFLVTNTGDYEETYAITAGPHTWTVNFPATLDGVPAGAEVEFSVAVMVPPGTPGGLFEDVNITVESTSDPAAQTTVTLKTISGEPIFFPFVGR